MSTMIATTMPTSTLADFTQYLATGQDPHERISPDVIADMNFPHTSFTVTGKADLDVLRAQVSDEDWVIRLESVEPISYGFLAVLEYDASRGHETSTFRTINVVSLAGDQISRLRHWCTGALA